MVAVGFVVRDRCGSLVQLVHTGVAKKPVEEKVAKQNAVLEAGHAENSGDRFSMHRHRQ